MQLPFQRGWWITHISKQRGCSCRSVARRGSAHRETALVNRVGHQRFAALERLAHIGQIGSDGLMTESITALLASARTVPCACRRARSTAHQAASRTITRTLTHGQSAGRRNGHVFVGHHLGPVRRRTASHAGSSPENQRLPMCSTHCVLWSTSAVLSLESTLGTVGGRNCRGDHFHLQ